MKHIVEFKEFSGSKTSLVPWKEADENSKPKITNEENKIFEV